jgi:hypothetical protein
MSFPLTFNLTQDWEEVAVSADGSYQAAISSNDVYLSTNNGVFWHRQSVKPWPPTSNFDFPIGNPFWNITGSGQWIEDNEVFKDGMSSLKTSGTNNTAKSHSVYTNGFFYNGEVDFYWRLKKQNSFDNVVFNFYVTRLIEENLQKTLITGLSINNTDSLWIPVRYTLPSSGFYNFEWQYSQSSTSPGTVWIDSVLLPSRILDLPPKNFEGDNLIPTVPFLSGEVYCSNNSGNSFSGVENFDKNFKSTSMSSNGQYQIITVESSGEDVYLSNDYGNNWIALTGVRVTSPGSWLDVDISEDSKYIVVAGINGSRINSTSGFGNWNLMNQTANSVGVAISNNGAYQSIVRRGGNAGDFQILRSDSFGESFTSVGPAKQWTAISMNGNGQYQSAVAENDYLYISHNYGQNWSGILTGFREKWSNIKISKNGQYQIASVRGGKLFFSQNYGLLWSGINLIKNWSAVSVNNDASILVATAKMDNIYYSYDYGNTWNAEQKLANWEDISLSADGKYQLLLNRSISEVKIKYTNFYTNNSGSFVNTYINTITGYGNLTSLSSGLGSGIISNPTGEQFQSAVIYQTGLLTGIISGNNGGFTWNVNLTGIAESGFVFLNTVTGTTQATGIIEFLDSTGFGLQDGDFIGINNITYTYRTASPSLPFEFFSIDNFLDILNSGATGAFNDIDFGFSQNNIGITGYKLDNKLILFSYARQGELGNQIRLTRNANNLNSIKIPSRYFAGGKDFRPKIDIFTGIFERKGSVFSENSGVYSRFIIDSGVEGQTFSPVWIDNFESGWSLYTGLASQGNSFDYIPVEYDYINNLFIGSGIIPSGRESRYTGLYIQFLKKKPYDISGNLSLYVLSGENFLYSGTLEG